MEDYFTDIASGWNLGSPESGVEILSNDMIEDSIMRACDFFQIDFTTGGAAETFFESGGFNRDQIEAPFFNQMRLESWGIMGQDSLDLTLAYDGTSHILQDFGDDNIDLYQKELCCDYMVGVRAGLSGIDISHMTESISVNHTEDNPLAGILRAEALEEGLNFAQDYLQMHNSEPDFQQCIESFCGSESFELGATANWIAERMDLDKVVQHYQDRLSEDSGLGSSIEEYRDCIERLFTARVEGDVLTEKISDFLSERMAKGIGDSDFHAPSQHDSISFGSRENMLSYDVYTIYDVERPLLNPFGVYAVSHSEGWYPPSDNLEKPYLPNDFTQEQLQEACNKICDAAGIRHLPVFITTDVSNAAFRSLPGPFLFTAFDDAICLNPIYARECIGAMGNTDAILVDLAHEIGHELNSLHCGSLSTYEDEKLADMFSSVIATKMGIDIDLLRQWNLWQYDPNGEGGYPPSEERWDISAAGKYYAQFSTIEDYTHALHDKHFLEIVQNYKTDPVSTLAQQELNYQLSETNGIVEGLKSVLDNVKKYLLIERL